MMARLMVKRQDDGEDASPVWGQGFRDWPSCRLLGIILAIILSELARIMPLSWLIMLSIYFPG